MRKTFRIAVLEKCRDCPALMFHLVDEESDELRTREMEDEQCYFTPFCDKGGMDSVIHDIDTIPEWCPLEDVEP